MSFVKNQQYPSGFSEKNAVWILILVCPRYRGNAERTVLVNIVYPIEMPSCSKFFRYDADSMALRGLYEVVLPS